MAGKSSLLSVRFDHECFGCGDANPIGLRLRFTGDRAGVRAHFTPQPEHQGFEGVVHGGIISSVLDEAMAWATAAAGHWAVTGEMRVRFRRPLGVGEETTVEAQVTGERGRLLTAAATLRLDASSEEVATATATFMRVDLQTEAAWRARYVAASEPRPSE